MEMAPFHPNRSSFKDFSDFNIFKKNQLSLLL